MKVLLMFKNALSGIFIFFKLLLYYMFVKNIFVNIFLGIIIFLLNYFNVTLIIGPFVGAVLTFNLINGYSYFSKEKNWNNIKNIILGDVYLFTVKFIMILRTNGIPFFEKEASRYEKLDESLNFTIPKSTDNFIEVFGIYEKYYLEMIKNDNMELEFSENSLNRYKKYFEEHISRLNQNVMMATVLFFENHKLICQLADFLKAVNHNMEFNYIKDENIDINKKLFLTQLLYLIINFKNIAKYIL